MTKGKIFSIIATAFALAFMATANAQNMQQQAAAPGTNTAAAVIGSPVTCEAKGVWQAGSAYLIIKRLDSVRHTVDIDGIPAGGIAYKWGGPESNARWTYQGNTLEYNRDNSRRYRLTIGADFLKGSYENFNAPTQSRYDIVYKCNGPLDQVIVR
ncbi:hypothetical protein K2Q00_03730 [Patescibacteria group bacterium]|nr:hypothetical protein [Patescibacteria group bacterium]